MFAIFVSTNDDMAFLKEFGTVRNFGPFMNEKEARDLLKSNGWTVHHRKSGEYGLKKRRVEYFGNIVPYVPPSQILSADKLPKADSTPVKS